MDDNDVATDYTVTTRDLVRVITITRPHRQNSLSESLMAGLTEEFLLASTNDDVRSIVLTGSGPRVFCAGADLKEMREFDTSGKEFRAPMNRPERNLFEVVTECPKPVIAALNGSAVAGGFELALACDIRIAASGIKLGLPEAKIGMGANFASVMLPKRIPFGIALEMLLTGDYISAEEAGRWGLVNRVVDNSDVMSTSMALAERIAGNAPVSLLRMKAMAVKSLDMPLSSALRLDVGPNPYLSADRIEGTQAYLENRKPNWSGR
jgi:enoyl-CoA hydratase